MSNDAKMAFDTIGKLAGLTLIFDPDFPARRISVELNNVTLEQALNIVSIESKAFLTPITENIILVIPDQPQKRRDYEEQYMREFYLSNTAQPQDFSDSRLEYLLGSGVLYRRLRRDESRKTSRARRRNGIPKDSHLPAVARYRLREI